MGQMNTISYALLGLLMEEPHSAYSLNQKLQRSITRVVWPMTASNVYAQVKNLVDMGFATVSEEYRGARARSVYEVTKTGRAALRAWLAEESAASLRLESEPLLKFIFAGAGKANNDEILLGIERAVESRLNGILQDRERVRREGALIKSSFRKGSLLELIVALDETCLTWCREQRQILSEQAFDEEDTSAYDRVERRVKRLLKSFENPAE